MCATMWRCMGDPGTDGDGGAEAGAARGGRATRDVGGAARHDSARARWGRHAGHARQPAAPHCTRLHNASRFAHASHAPAPSTYTSLHSPTKARVLRPINLLAPALACACSTCACPLPQPSMPPRSTPAMRHAPALPPPPPRTDNAQHPPSNLTPASPSLPAPRPPQKLRPSHHQPGPLNLLLQAIPAPVARRARRPLLSLPL
jgi:hypothetical protein